LLLQLGQIFIYSNLFLVLSFLFLHKKFSNSFSQLTLLSIGITGCMPFIILMIGFIISDFSILNVATNSFIDDPLFYKIASSWGSHEGSILLWIFIINLYLLTYLLSDKNYKNIVKNILLIEISFIFYVILSSNPFVYLESFSNIKGLGLNPVLQHFLFVIHPPILFLGYIGLIIPFAIAVHMLSSQKFEKKYFSEILKWSKISWFFLTLGIVLGSYWAYSELGWGGWWFWDPVENVSLIPWLLTTALIHSTAVSIKKNELKIWSLNLCLYAFIAAIFGTFLVRSNLIISVHSFASDPLRGMYLLAIVAYLLSFALFLNIKSLKLFNQDKFDLLSRESFLLLNNVFFISAALTVFIGTIYPLFAEIIYQEKVSVGAPYYNMTFNILLAPAILLMSIAPRLSWGENKTNLKLIIRLVSTTILIGVISFLIWNNIYFTFASILCFPIIAMSIVAIPSLLKNRTITFLSQWLAHLSIALFILAAVFTEQFDKDYNIEFSNTSNATQFIDPLIQVTLNGISESSHSNHQKITVGVTIKKSGKIIELSPSKNIYQPSGEITTEVSKKSYLFDNFYSTITSITENNVVLNIVYKPLINLLWLSTMLLIASIGLSIFRKEKYE
jgi:cytochrome c-type biogenesis protein CcmF|tara:strand:- start:6 stop:1853 length:1848 start_codon:yes stop_codon:yes gene_type:complete